MLSILPSYISHHLKYPDSLIAKIFGVFTVRRDGMAPVILCLMENTVQLKQPQMLRYKFDLKGSTAGRRTKSSVVMTSKTDRKDLDFLDLKQKEKEKLSFAEINKHLITILKRDVFYLKQRGLLDYSLLMAVEISTKKFQPAKLVEKRLTSNIKNSSVNAAAKRDRVMSKVSQNLNRQMNRITKNLVSKGFLNTKEAFNDHNHNSEVKLNNLAKNSFNKT